LLQKVGDGKLKFDSRESRKGPFSFDMLGESVKPNRSIQSTIVTSHTLPKSNDLLSSMKREGGSINQKPRRTKKSSSSFKPQFFTKSGKHAVEVPTYVPIGGDFKVAETIDEERRNLSSREGRNHKSNNSTAITSRPITPLLKTTAKGSAGQIPPHVQREDITPWTPMIL